MIDSGSCRNVISDEAVTKLGLVREKHPAPYTLTWLNDTATVRITQRALVAFSIGSLYKDHIFCDIAPMDISHLLLGGPCEFDQNVLHNGTDYTSQFTWDTHKIVLLPSKETVILIPPTNNPVDTSTPTRSTNLLCSYTTFISELRSEGRAFAIIPAQ